MMKVVMYLNGMMSLKTQKNGLVIIFEKRMQWNGNMRLMIFKMNN
uniref:Uncharacterized protein n=1 Tax=Myoviridae sp. ctcFb5 TaxID=2825137 RepID=A0A8S5PWB5_9CAUD|nr:MAG TPA: hypothetical protein [Myoviridae sp. ctcFb5]